MGQNRLNNKIKTEQVNNLTNKSDKAMNITPLHYRKIHLEIKPIYEKYTGSKADLSDTSKGFYTIPEQVERYAKNLAFWILMDRNLDRTSATTDPITFAKLAMFNNGKVSLLKRVEEMFPDYVRELIMTRTDELVQKGL